MPGRPARICVCGKLVPGGVRCECQVQRDREHDARRPTAAARGYDGWWNKTRRAYLDKHKICTRCGALSEVVHHKIPHRGDRKLFTDVKGNWEAVCTHCHNTVCQREDRAQ